MIIKRKSWHYKLNRLFKNSWHKDDTNLCTYFWRVVFNGSILAFVSILIILIGIIWFSSSLWVSNTICLTWAILTVILPFVTIYYLREYFGIIGTPIPYIVEEGVDVVCDKLQVEFIFEYIKAWKEKHCPLIEYEE